MSTSLRLDDDLVREAEAEARVHMRSAPKQIEYWASLGKILADHIANTQDLLAIKEGFARIELKLPETQPLDAESVFEAVEKARESGELRKAVSQAPVRYQASTTHPGMLEAINPAGNRQIGQFQGGTFVPLAKPADAE